jgi:hypothetical protein
MPAPAVTYLVSAFGPGAAATFRAAEKKFDVGVNFVVATDPANLDELVELKKSLALSGPCIKILGFGDGVIRKADAVNAMASEAADGLLVPLLAGDVVDYEFVERAEEAIEQGRGTVGAAYCDYTSAPYGFRTYAEPFGRERTTAGAPAPAVFAVTKEAFLTTGGFRTGADPLEELDFWLRLTTRYLPVHFPRPLARLSPRPPLDQRAADAAWNRILRTEALR